MSKLMLVSSWMNSAPSVGCLSPVGRPLRGPAELRRSVTAMCTSGLKRGEALHDAVCARVAGLELERRSEEHTSELQSRQYLVCRLLLEKKRTGPSPPAGMLGPLRRNISNSPLSGPLIRTT